LTFPAALCLSLPAIGGLVTTNAAGFGRPLPPEISGMAQNSSRHAD
jgi:hypothetical protein